MDAASLFLSIVIVAFLVIVLMMIRYDYHKRVQEQEMEGKYQAKEMKRWERDNRIDQLTFEPYQARATRIDREGVGIEIRNDLVPVLSYPEMP